ncbi:MAG: hypothetical protein FWF57_00410 [Defluviitaleaceae bacterium]|nr:hypothetical protein [Defluviitaleaceae bacterium]
MNHKNKLSFVLAFVLFLSYSIFPIRVLGNESLQELDLFQFFNFTEFPIDESRTGIMGFSTLDENQRIHLFANQYDLEEKSLLEIGRNRLIESGFSQDFIDSMDSRMVELIATANIALSSERYFLEVIHNEKESSMEEISRTRFEEITNNNISNSVIENLPEHLIGRFTIPPIPIVDYDGNVLYDPTRPDSRTVRNVGGGTLHVNTNVFGINSGILSHFITISEFFWQNMPSFRGTDFFGVTRDNNTSVIPNAWSNYFTHDVANVTLVASGTGVGVQQIYNGSHNAPITYNLPNAGASNPLNGYAVSLSMPRDILPNTIFPNQIFNARFMYNARGGVSFEGVLQSPSIRPQNFNIFSSYHHQTSTSWFSSPTLSVPAGASITISPSANYAAPVVDVALATWR